MDIATRNEQIIRIQSHSPSPELNEALETKLKTEFLEATQTFLEGLLQEELQGHLSQITEDRPRRSGYFHLVLDTEYGRIQALTVNSDLAAFSISLVR